MSVQTSVTHWLDEGGRMVMGPLADPVADAATAEALEFICANIGRASIPMIRIGHEPELPKPAKSCPWWVGALAVPVAVGVAIVLAALLMAVQP